MGHSRDNGRDRSSRTNDSKISRSYRSPPSSRGRDDHRSRRDSTPPQDLSSSCLSDFYKKRFGSHSPEDYLNLRMTQFDKSLSTEDIKSILEREFRHLAPFEVQIKIVRNPEDEERLAYVNFEGRNCAKSVRKALVPRLRKVLGRNIAIDPAGVVRDQEGKLLPDRFNRAAISDPRVPKRSFSPSQQKFRRSIGSIGLPPRRDPRQMVGQKLNQDDDQAGRTLFVGNLPGDIRESELRRAFEQFGNVEDIDIKILAENTAAYAFILMGTVEEAIVARREQHGRPIRPGGQHCQLGYGKTQVSSRIMVGGLGTWATEGMLRKAFERFGEVESIDYEEGDSHAYIQYGETGPAIDAVGEMKNFPLDGKHLLTTDFIRDPNAAERPKVSRKRPVRERDESPDDESDANSKEVEIPKKRAVRMPSVSPSQSPSRAGYLTSFDDFKEQVAATWKGNVVLKKTDYLMSFHRLFGREHLIQEYLRDNSGASLRLVISQRLPMVPDLFQKLLDFDRKELALMLAVQADKSIEPLISYLLEKNAAGVVSVENACLYVFPNSEMSEKLLKFFTPRIKFIKPDDKNYLIMALKKTQNLQQQQKQFLSNSGLNELPNFSAPTGVQFNPSIQPAQGAGATIGSSMGIVPAHSSMQLFA